MKKQAADIAEKRRKTLIVGLGKTGLSCARYLSSRGVPLAVTDSREFPPALEQLREELPDAALFLGGFNADAFSAAERLIVSPGVSLSEPLIQQAIAQGVSVLGDIELFCQVVNAPYVAITGSNGKSTVTSLLGEMAAAQNLRVKVGGNIGQPALDLLDEEVDLYVLELSSFQLETTHSLKPAAATVLNLVPDHLDRYPDYQSYVEAKRKVYAHAEIRCVQPGRCRCDGDAVMIVKIACFFHLVNRRKTISACVIIKVKAGSHWAINRCFRFPNC